MLRRFVLAATVIALPLSGVSLSRAQTPAAATTPITPLTWLYGGVWTADASAMGNGMLRIETRYRPSDNGAFLRFTTHFVSTRGTLNNYDGQFFYDPTQHALRLWYMSAHGDLTAGTITIEGDRTHFAFTGTNFEGQPADLAVDVLRQTPDRYTWTLQENSTTGWKKLAELTYIRKPE